jgi:MFS family permease
MNTVHHTTTAQQRAGGIAALYLGAAFLLAMPFFLVVVDYPGATDAAEKVVLLDAHHASMQVMYLITYVVFGVVLAVLALALHERLSPWGPTLMRVATAVGLMWAVVLVASGMVFNAGMAAVVDLYSTSPDQAQSMWQAIEPVAQGLGSGSGGEFLGGLWVLLVSVVSLRGRSLPRSLGWLGLVVGFTGLLSIIPPFSATAYVFGLLMIVWFAWLGIALLRSGAGSLQEVASAPELVGSAASA